VTPVWRAFANMSRAAARDPLWALACVVFSPIRGGIYLAKSLLMALIVALVLLFAVSFAVEAAGQKGAWPHRLGNIAAGLVAVAVFWRFASRPLIDHFGDTASDTHGSARFANQKELKPLAKAETGLLIGRDSESGALLRYDGSAHLITMAPTRAGKGVGAIIPNLLIADRSIVCIDPKGENARVAWRARDRFGPVHVLDPFGVTGLPSAAFDPLADLDAGSLDVAEDAAALADALVYDAPGEAGEAHWNEEAKALLAGVILYVVAHEPPGRPTLSTVRDLITSAPDVFATMLKIMQQSEAAGGLIARAANRHLAKSDREGAGVLSAAQRHTHFLDSPRMARVLGRSDFRFADSKERTATVFLVLPPDRLSTYARWLRLLVTQSLAELARSPVRPAAPVLYLLDEFAALGRLESVERAFALMAGYGVQLWPILQDVHQLRAAYGQRAGTFLSNAGVLQVFGVNDHDSARMISDLLGQQTVVFQPMSRALDSEKSGISLSQHHVGRPLLTPDEVRNLPQDTELLFLAGQRPIVAKKLRYFEDREFAGLFDPA
jgi:type IV secretion system protein VirD4